jgi:hypothetical protein
LLLSSCDLGVQRIQALLPERSVVAQPLVDLGERLGTQAVHPKLRLLADLYEAGLTQHPQVPGDPGASDGQQSGQLTHSCGAIAESI